MRALREAVTSSFSTALSFAAGVASAIWLAKVAAECGKGPAGERGGAVDWTVPGALPDVLFELELEGPPQGRCPEGRAAPQVRDRVRA